MINRPLSFRDVQSSKINIIDHINREHHTSPPPKFHRNRRLVGRLHTLPWVVHLAHLESYVSSVGPWWAYSAPHFVPPNRDANDLEHVDASLHKDLLDAVCLVVVVGAAVQSASRR